MITLATRPSAPPQRRVTEQDADYQRLHTATVGKLSRTIRRYVRALRHSSHNVPAASTTVFIHQMTGTLRNAYSDAHREGQRQYWASVSRKTRGLPLLPEPPQRRMQDRLAWYALPSVSKMALEGQAAERA